VSRALQLLITVILFVFIALAARNYLFFPDGEALFKEQGCVRCHTINGVGRGPIDLSHVSEKWSAERIKDQIRNPRVNNPDTAMPNFGHLSKKEVNALIKFLKGES
jgi:mono/diheme cytochrome c family protein